MNKRASTSGLVDFSELLLRCYELLLLNALIFLAHYQQRFAPYFSR